MYVLHCTSLYIFVFFCLGLHGEVDISAKSATINFNPAFSGTPSFVHGVVTYGRFIIIKIFQVLIEFYH